MLFPVHEENNFNPLEYQIICSIVIPPPLPLFLLLLFSSDFSGYINAYTERVFVGVLPNACFVAVISFNFASRVTKKITLNFPQSQIFLYVWLLVLVFAIDNIVLKVMCCLDSLTMYCAQIFATKFCLFVLSLPLPLSALYAHLRA